MPTASSFAQRVCTTITANIANGQTVSTAIDLGGASMAGIIMPAAFTGATISFKVSDTLAGTYVPLKNTAGTTISFTVSASTAIGFSPTDFAAWQYIQIVSASAEGGSRDIKVIPRSV